MLRLFLISTLRFAGIAGGALLRSPDGLSPVRPRRVLVMLGFLPVFAVAQAIHWLGFLLDEIFFRGYRRVAIREPLFVLGVPRSGTTNLHAVLAQDPQLTTFSTWECLFAPSVTQRVFWRALGRLDARLGGPLRRLLSLVERRFFAALDDVHAMSLDTPEEDYFALLPVLSCFILALPFPHAAHLWRMGTFDRDMPAAERERLLAFYADALRRHLYVHGPDKRLLSKNAAFASLAGSLAAQFPDARFLVCLRDPVQTVPSQLSSIRAGLAFFGVPEDSAPIRERFVDQLAFYYENLNALARTGAPTRTVVKTLPQLKHDLAGAVRDAYSRLGLPLTPDFATALEAAAAPARAYRSGHRYALADFGLDADSIVQRFAGAYTEAGSGDTTAVAARNSPGPGDAQTASPEPAGAPAGAAASTTMHLRGQAAGASRC
ncbi:sulfotransferase [uncultured Thiohalocapsa sp.]|uniref:sulfotransferase n=1 Tax=uncultured Thiohalocapsa sp. TaxID=768990 RepID=UPI0025FDAB85|nr:sulfotransferase [uncultured Thiohalocapsa sp.]